MIETKCDFVWISISSIEYSIQIWYKNKSIYVLHAQIYDQHRFGINKFFPQIKVLCCGWMECWIPELFTAFMIWIMWHYSRNPIQFWKQVKGHCANIANKTVTIVYVLFRRNKPKIKAKAAKQNQNQLVWFFV